MQITIDKYIDSLQYHKLVGYSTVLTAARIKCEVRKCENGQCIKCEIESAKWGCENMYKMRKCEKRFCAFII